MEIARGWGEASWRCRRESGSWRNENNGGKQSNTESYSMHIPIPRVHECLCHVNKRIMRDVVVFQQQKNTSTNTSENEKLFSFLLLINSCHLYSVEFAAFKKLPNKLFALRSRSNKAHLRNLYVYIRIEYSVLPPTYLLHANNFHFLFVFFFFLALLSTGYRAEQRRRWRWWWQWRWCDAEYFLRVRTLLYKHAKWHTPNAFVLRVGRWGEDCTSWVLCPALHPYIFSLHRG